MADDKKPISDDLERAYTEGREGSVSIYDDLVEISGIRTDEEKEAKQRGNEERINAEVSKKES